MAQSTIVYWRQPHNYLLCHLDYLRTTHFHYSNQNVCCMYIVSPVLDDAALQVEYTGINRPGRAI